MLPFVLYAGFMVMLPSVKAETRNGDAVSSGGADEASSIREKKPIFPPEAC